MSINRKNGFRNRTGGPLRFPLGDGQNTIPARSRQRRAFRNPVAADLGENDLGGIFQPIRFCFKGRGFEKPCRNAEMLCNGVNGRLICLHVDREDTCQRIFGDKFRHRPATSSTRATTSCGSVPRSQPMPRQSVAGA